MPVLSTARQGIAKQYLRGDQKVQWSCRTFVRNDDRQRFLAAAQGAEIGHRPVQISQLQQAFNETDHLPERKAKQHFQSFSVIAAQ